MSCIRGVSLNMSKKKSLKKREDGLPLLSGVALAGAHCG